jgi:AraC-like DNA-binding protein
MTRWEQVKAVARMQDHVAGHLCEPITLQALARVARYSPWYAARIFRDVTGMTPFDYVRACRLAAAADRIRQGAERVVDVAFDFDFGSHEGFTRAFARQFGMPPSRYRREGSAPRPFLPPPAREFYRSLQRGEIAMSDAVASNTVFVQVVERPARRFVLKRGREATHYFEYCEEVGCEVWSALAAIEGALHEPMGAWLPDRFRAPGTSLYCQGVEVPGDWAGPVPDGFDVIDLPPCRMMVFQGPPYDDAAFESAITDLWAAMKTYDPTIYGFAWADDDGPRFQLEPRGYRGYIEGRPVRPLRG